MHNEHILTSINLHLKFTFSINLCLINYRDSTFVATVMVSNTIQETYPNVLFLGEFSYFFKVFIATCYVLLKTIINK